MPGPGGDAFRAAARAYFAYGVVYLAGGVYLVLNGVGVTGSRLVGALEWGAVGLAILLLVPYLLRRPRAWFERWILSRRDFARVLALFMAFRAVRVGLVVIRAETGSVPAPWGGVVTFQAGGLVFFLVTVVALAFVARAAWQSEPSR